MRRVQLMIWKKILRMRATSAPDRISCYWMRSGWTWLSSLSTRAERRLKIRKTIRYRTQYMITVHATRIALMIYVACVDSPSRLVSQSCSAWMMVRVNTNSPPRLF